ncbi:MAG: transglutaminase-like domain-containing protein [Candidatus Woesearchaeota archaeon]
MGDGTKALSYLLAIALGAVPTYLYVSHKKNKEIESNLSEKVVKVTEVERTSPIEAQQVSIDHILLEDESLFMVYAHDIGNYNYKFWVKASDYLKFKSQRHRKHGVEDYVNFVTYSHPKIKSMAQKLTEGSSSKEKSAQLLLDFVHQHIYDKSIEEDRDYVRYPIETLVERNGDCEDFSILAAALMKSIGIGVALIHLPAGEGEKSGHLALGVEGDFSGHFYNIDGKKYYYAETTGTEWPRNPTGWEIGDIPKEYREKEVNLHIVK